MVLICWREATSGNTPPNWAWMSIWEATTLERIRRPSSTTAAAVSSQEVSIPRIRMGGLSTWEFLVVEVLGILCFLRAKFLFSTTSICFYRQYQIHGEFCQHFHLAIRAYPKAVFKPDAYAFLRI